MRAVHVQYYPTVSPVIGCWDTWLIRWVGLPPTQGAASATRITRERRERRRRVLVGSLYWVRPADSAKLIDSWINTLNASLFPVFLPLSTSLEPSPAFHIHPSSSSSFVFFVSSSSIPLLDPSPRPETALRTISTSHFVPVGQPWKSKPPVGHTCVKTAPSWIGDARRRSSHGNTSEKTRV